MTIFVLSSPHYSCLSRVIALAVQVLSAAFVQALIIGLYLNPDDGECAAKTNQRACQYPRSAYFPDDQFSKCVWATVEHSCRFRQPQQEWFCIAVTVVVAAIVGAPLARLVEWQVVRLSAPKLGIYGAAAAAVAADGEYSSKSEWFCSQRRRGKYKRVAPLRGGTRNNSVANGKDSVVTSGHPPFLHDAASYSDSNGDLFRSGDVRPLRYPLRDADDDMTNGGRNNRYRCLDRVKAVALETELERLLGAVADRADWLADRGDTADAFELLSKAHYRYNLLLS